MEKFLSIQAESRHKVGKKGAKKIRAMGKIPAIIYGGKKETISIAITLVDLHKILKSEKKENTLLRIRRDDIEVDAMLKEIQYDYLSDNIIHADFLRIEMDKPVTVSVPIVATGEPVGVRIEDGIFDFVNREVRVSCLASDIPANIELDVSELHAGHSIKVESLEISDKLTMISDPGTVICAVTVKGEVEEVIEEELEEIEEAEGEEAAGEGKPEGQPGEKGEEKTGGKDDVKDEGAEKKER